MILILGGQYDLPIWTQTVNAHKLAGCLKTESKMDGNKMETTFGVVNGTDSHLGHSVPLLLFHSSLSRSVSNFFADEVLCFLPARRHPYQRCLLRGLPSNRYGNREAYAVGPDQEL